MGSHMQIETLIVPTLDSAIDLLAKAINGSLDDGKSYEIQFGDWLKFALEVSGERYSSTLPASSLRAISQYQAVINSFCAFLMYGNTAQSLTDDDKKELELIFHFSEGSTKADADLTDTITTLGMAAIERMDGNQLVITTVTVAIIIGVYFGYTRFLAHASERHKTDAQQDIVRAAIESNAALAKLNAELSSSAVSLAKSVSDADSLRMGNLTLDGRDIENYVRRERGRRSHQRIDGAYRVIRIAESDDGYRIGLEGDDGTQLTASLTMDGASSEKILSDLLGSVHGRNAVYLHVVAKFQGSVLVEASILTGHIQSTMLSESDETDPD